MTFNSNATLWVLTPFGAQDDNQQQNGGGTATEQKPPEGTNQEQSQGNSSQQSNGGSETEEDDPYSGLSTKELKRLLADSEKGKTATESEKKALQDKIDADERKKKTELENAQNDLANEKAGNDKLRQTFSRVALENSILKDERFTWHNVDDVISKLPENVKVDDDGKVSSNLAAALGKIAKDNEYLVKSTETQGNSQQQQNNGNQNNGPTGFQPGQGGANQGGGLPPNQTELVKDYPALASRINGAPQGPFMPNQVMQG